MKKILLFAAVLVTFVACKNDEPQRQEAVTFHVQGLKAESTPMNAPRKVAPLVDDDGSQMTDLILFAF